MNNTSSCNNCKQSDYTVVYKRNVAQVHQIVKCKNCGLMYAYPLNIDPTEMYWEGSSNTPSKKPLFSKQLGNMVDVKEKIQVSDYLPSIKYVEKLLPFKGNALEIGSSRGHFLHELEKRGWEVDGIEPSDGRREEAKRIFGFKCIPDKLEDTSFDANCFDAIFMFHVIEHVLDPAFTISILYRYLKPGGILVIETPTYDTITYKILQHRERSIRCDSHFTFFTKKTLRNMLEKAEFVTMRHDRVGRTLTFERLFWNFSVIFKSELVDRFLEKLSKFGKLRNFKIYLNTGDMQRIYCRK
jgi:SAM-dependent methyltransferase